MTRKITVTVSDDGKINFESEGCTLIDALGMAEYVIAVTRYELLCGLQAHGKVKIKEKQEVQDDSTRSVTGRF